MGIPPVVYHLLMRPDELISKVRQPPRQPTGQRLSEWLSGACSGGFLEHKHLAHTAPAVTISRDETRMVGVTGVQKGAMCFWRPETRRNLPAADTCIACKPGARCASGWSRPGLLRATYIL